MIQKLFKKTGPTLDDLRAQLQRAEQVLADARQEETVARTEFYGIGGDEARLALKKARDRAQDAEDDLERARHLVAEGEAAKAEADRAEMQRRVEETSNGINERIRIDKQLVSEEVEALKVLAAVRVRRRDNLADRWRLEDEQRELEKSLRGGIEVARWGSLPSMEPGWEPVREAILSAVDNGRCGEQKVSAQMQHFASGQIGERNSW